MMKKRLFALILSIFMTISFISCAKTDDTVLDDADDDTKQEVSETEYEKEIESIIEDESEENLELLSGEWMFVSGQVEGYEFSSEEAGFTTNLSISEGIAYYEHIMDNDKKSFTAQIEYLNKPLYEMCANDKWSVKFVPVESDFDKEEEFYATLIDDNTLLLQNFYPFDGLMGVSYQTYTRK